MSVVTNHYNDYRNKQVYQQNISPFGIAFDTSLGIFFSTTAARELIIVNL
jgi:hypothetical protein